MNCRCSSLRLLVLLLTSLVVSAGCSWVTDSPQDAASAVVEDAEPDELEFSDTASRANSWSGSVVALALVRPTERDPRLVNLSDQAAVIVADLLFDGLTEAVGTSEELRPGLALSWEADDDLMVWTFELDPERVDADTVAASLSGALIGSDDATGAPDFGAEILLSGIESVTALDEETIVIKSLQPMAGLPWMLSGLGASIVGSQGEPTGRYEIVVDDAAGLVLRALDGGPGVQLVWSQDPAEAYDRLTLGAVDGAVIDNLLVADAKSRFGSQFATGNVSYFLTLNARSVALGEAGERRAVMAALDRKAVADAASTVRAVVEVDGAAGPGIAGYRAGSCDQVCEYDPESMSDYTGGEALAKIRVGYVGVEDEVVAALVVAQLQDSAVEAEAVLLEPAELAVAVANGDVEMVVSGWIAPASSLDGVVPGLFGSQSGLNLSGVSDAAVDDLLARAGETSNDQVRWGLLADAQDAAIAAGSVVPLVVGTSLLVDAPGGPELVVRSDGSLDLARIGE